MLSFGKKDALLGIDITSSAVKLIELSKDKSSYRVESYAVASINGTNGDDNENIDVAAVADAIQRVLRQSRTKNRHCALGIPSSVAISKIIKVSAEIPATEMEAQVMMEAETHIPYPMNEVNFDFEVLGPCDDDPEMIDVLLAATRSENIEARLEACEQAGLTVDIVDLDSHAIENVFTKMVDDLDSNEVVAVIDFGSVMTGINIFKNGRVIFAREQLFGGKQLTEEIMRRYGLSYAEAGLAKKNGNLPENYANEVLSPFRENMVRQVQRFLQFYHASSMNGKVDKILLSGGTSGISGICGLVQDATSISVSLANPFNNVPLNSKIDPARFYSDVPSILVSTGLALRGVA